MAERPQLQCKFLDGTGAVQCLWQGRYRYQRRGKPTQARKASGERETGHGTVSHMPFLICEPAEAAYVATQLAQNAIPSTNTPESARARYDQMVSKQADCSKFKEMGS